MLAGAYKKVPLIIGYCDAEGMLGLFLGAKAGREPVHKDFENFVPFTFGVEKGSVESKRIAQTIKKFYYKETEPSLETLANYIEVSNSTRKYIRINGRNILVGDGLLFRSWSAKNYQKHS